MKLAAASSAFDRAIAAGDLTQLEFLDLCANDAACDGAVLDVRHFPRTDGDYLAQIKKMATDRGLALAALSDAGLYALDDDAMRARFEQALALGTPLLAAPLCAETAMSWLDQLTRLGVATALAKEFNITLALRNAPGTFAASDRDCKRVSKEADSAWLRYGPEPATFDGASDATRLRANVVLLWSSIADNAEESARRLLEGFDNFGGYVVVDDAKGTADAATLHATLRAWSGEVYTRTLDRA